MKMPKKKKVLKKLVSSEIEFVATFEQDGKEYSRYGYLFHTCGCVACSKSGKPYVFTASVSIVVPYTRYVEPSDVTAISKTDGIYYISFK